MQPVIPSLPWAKSTDEVGGSPPPATSPTEFELFGVSVFALDQRECGRLSSPYLVAQTTKSSQRGTRVDESLNRALQVAEELLRRAGRTLSESNRRSLLEPVESLDDKARSEIESLYEPMWRGFFHCAAQGLAFLAPSSIKERFGRSLEENYPGASSTFLRFATTYWTFKLMEGELFPEHSNKGLAQILSKLEFEIGSIFFPTPGPVPAPEHKREQAQREIIRDSGASIDVEDFIRGNPILRPAGRPAV